MLFMGNRPCSHSVPSTVCRPLGLSFGSNETADRKHVKPSGEKMASRKAGETADMLHTSFVQRARRESCSRPLCASVERLTLLAKAGLAARSGGRSFSLTGRRSGRKRSSISFRASFFPMKTILTPRCSCSPQSGPSEVSVMSATAWKTSFADLPAAASTPFERYRFPSSGGRVAMTRIHLAKASGSTSTPFLVMLKLPISLSWRSATLWPWPPAWAVPWPPPWPPWSSVESSPWPLPWSSWQSSWPSPWLWPPPWPPPWPRPWPWPSSACSSMIASASKALKLVSCSAGTMPFTEEMMGEVAL
mmetsp:Transcript_42184/g.111511  ORF Transcript_42184/g.111511 Transcript_42184/m.111511 type:complete len:304 (+) Transcript_42184:722-1633(+)